MDDRRRWKGLAPGQLQWAIDHLLDSAPDAILCIDGSGTIVVANAEAERVFGFEASELVGNAIEMLVPVASRARHEDLRRSYVDAPVRRDMGSSKRLSLFARRKDGTEFPAEISLSPAAGAGDLHVTCIVRDVSERKQLEARALLNERLANAALITAGLGHEIRNPLTALIANLEFAVRQLPDGDDSLAALRAALEDCLYGAGWVHRITNDLDAMAAPGGDRMTAVDVRDLVSTAVRLSAVDKSAGARVELDLRAVPMVRTDKGMLGQVLLNLIANAGHAVHGLPAGRRVISIRVFSNDGGVTVEVGDNGPGIPAKVLPRIFEPFFTTRAANGGTGIGLAVARAMVEELGGSLTVSSSRGRGARFRVALPAAQASAIDAASAGAVIDDARVVVVDDDESITRLLERVLGDHRVTTVNSARDAIDLLSGIDGVDLILCDIFIDGVEGAEVFRAVTEARPELADRFVFMTGGAFTERARSFLASVPNRHIEKPFRFDDIEALLRH